MVGKKNVFTTSDFCDRDTERPPEEQLDHLQRAYRPADLKRAVFYSKTQSNLNKQQRIADILNKEKSELQLNYKKGREGAFLRQDAMWLRQFEDLLKCQATSKAIKDEESHKIKEIDEKIRQTDKQMHQLRVQLKEMRKNKCPVISNEKVIQILENKLYQENVAHNKVVYKNSILREYLQHLSILRTRFNILYSQYNKVLSKGKHKIHHLCKEAATAQDQREEIRAHLLSLNKYSTMQYNKLLAEVQEMSRLAKLKGKHVPFMLTKEKARVGYPESFGAKQEKVDTKPEEQLKFYQDTFEKIKTATQKTDSNEIVKHFIQTEEDNFKLFNYANELRDECEHIQENINHFQEKLREANRQDEIEREKFVATKEKLEQKLKEMKSRRSSLQGTLNSCRKTFNEFKEGITKLYKVANCNDEYLSKTLCGKNGVTTYNILDYLSILESWVFDLMPFFDYLTNRVKICEAEKEAEKQRTTTSKYDVRTYSKLSAISGSITPSIQTSIGSAEPTPDVEDVKSITFPEFDLPQLSRETTSSFTEDLPPLKHPYTKSELKIVAEETLWKIARKEKKSLKKRMP